MKPFNVVICVAAIVLWSLTCVAVGRDAAQQQPPPNGPCGCIPEVGTCQMPCVGCCPHGCNTSPTVSR